jgi:hypothetical protein
LCTFLHVAEKGGGTPPDAEHPFQGWLPYLKLVWQPSLQLLEIFSNAASFSMFVPGPANIAAGEVDRIAAAGDLRGDATVCATRCGGRCGLATCFGASTVMLGSWEPEPVAVCDIAGPLRPNSNAVDRIATVEDARRLDDDLMTCPSKSGTENAVPMGAQYHNTRTGTTRRRHGSYRASANHSPLIAARAFRGSV